MFRWLAIDATRLTACVTRWWAGRDNAILTESTSSHATCLKNVQTPTSRVHAVLGRLAVWATITFCRDIIITPAGITKILACFVRDENNFI